MRRINNITIKYDVSKDDGQIIDFVIAEANITTSHEQEQEINNRIRSTITRNIKYEELNDTVQREGMKKLKELEETLRQLSFTKKEIDSAKVIVTKKEGQRA